jgi:hypothetical protein
MHQVDAVAESTIAQSTKLKDALLESFTGKNDETGKSGHNRMRKWHMKSLRYTETFLRAISCSWNRNLDLSFIHFRHIYKCPSPKPSLVIYTAN